MLTIADLVLRKKLVASLVSAMYQTDIETRMKVSRRARSECGRCRYLPVGGRIQIGQEREVLALICHIVVRGLKVVNQLGEGQGYCCVPCFVILAKVHRAFCRL